jgi:phosphoglycolate phosphatase
MSSEVRFIVFDWDGTLMDSEAQIVSCLHAALADLQIEPMDDETVKDVIGLGLKEAIDTLVPGQDDRFHLAFVQHYRKYWFNSEGSSLFAGVRAMLDDFRERDLLLGIATGKSRKGLNRVLEETGLAGHFHATRCADEAPSKPHPQMLLDLIERFDVSPEQTIMVGDTEYDMDMATQAGTGKVAVCSGVHTEERLSRHTPLASLQRVTEMPAWMRATGRMID